MAAEPRRAPQGAAAETRRAGLLALQAREARASFGRLFASPVGNLLTVIVIGVALALPAGLQLLVANARQLSGAWEGAARLSVFTEPGTQAQAVERLARELRRRDDVAEVSLISSEQALAEFRELSGFGAALDLLEENPLPAVLVVRPSRAEPARLEALRAELAELPDVDLVQLDAQWLRRLDAMLDIARRAVLLAAGLFALAVAVVVFNTIRLDIQNRRDEIEVVKLIGATDAFIRRPFLWEGMLLGASGGLAAWLLIEAGLLVLAEPVRTLAGLYGAEYALLGPGIAGLGALLGTGAGLGWLGSFAAVTRHLGEIEPR
jgi:cell division transport system permease protein